MNAEQIAPVEFKEDRIHALERLTTLVETVMSKPQGMRSDDIMRVMPGYRQITNKRSRDKQFDRDREQLVALGFDVSWSGDENANTTTHVLKISGLQADMLRLDLDSQQASLALLALRFMNQQQSGGPWGRLLHKVLAYAPAEIDEVDLPYRVHSGVKADQVPDLVAAINSVQAIRFEYSSGSTEVRSVEPWQVSEYEGRWYLYGWDIVREAPRLFRLERIRSKIVVTGPAFVARPAEMGGPEPVDLVARALTGYKREQQDEFYSVELQVTAGKLPGARSRHGWELKAEQVSARQMSSAELVRLALANYRWVKVNAPSAAREHIAAGYKRIADIHRAEPTFEFPITTAKKVRGVGGKPALTDEFTLAQSLYAFVSARGEVTEEYLASQFNLSVNSLRKTLDRVHLASNLADGYEQLIGLNYGYGYVSISDMQHLNQPLGLNQVECETLLLALSQTLSFVSAADCDAAAGLVEMLLPYVSLATLRQAQEILKAPGNDLPFTEAIAHNREVFVLYLAEGDAMPYIRSLIPRGYLLSRYGLYVIAENEHSLRLDRCLEISADREVISASLMTWPKQNSSLAEQLTAHLAQVSPASEVVLRLSPAARWIQEAFAEQIIGETFTEADASVLVRMQAKMLPQLIDAVFECCGEAEICAPVVLRECVLGLADAGFRAHSH